MPALVMTQERGTEPVRVLTMVSVVIFANLSAATFAAAQAPEDLAAGRRLFVQKGNCQACHGWAGDGRKVDSQMPDAPNLRERQLDREVVVTTIKCGRP